MSQPGRREGGAGTGGSLHPRLFCARYLSCMISFYFHNSPGERVVILMLKLRKRRLRGESLPSSGTQGGCEFRSGWPQPPSPAGRPSHSFAHQNDPTLAHTSYGPQRQSPQAPPVQLEEGHILILWVTPFTITYTKRMVEIVGPAMGCF